jgi:hypothetical protein
MRLRVALSTISTIDCFGTVCGDHTLPVSQAAHGTAPFLGCPECMGCRPQAEPELPHSFPLLSLSLHLTAPCIFLKQLILANLLSQGYDDFFNK